MYCPNSISCAFRIDVANFFSPGVALLLSCWNVSSAFASRIKFFPCWMRDFSADSRAASLLRFKFLLLGVVRVLLVCRVVGRDATPLDFDLLF